jgi:hypothetical protein
MTLQPGGPTTSRNIRKQSAKQGTSFSRKWRARTGAIKYCPHVLSLIGKKCKKMTRNHAGYRHASGWMQRLLNKSPDNAMKCL